MGKQRSRKRMTLLSTFILTMLLVVSFIVLILLGLRILSMPPTRYEDDHVLKSHDLPSVVRQTTVDSDDREKQWVEVISWKPRAFVYHNFLSKEECEHIIELAKPYMIRSTVIANDNETGAIAISSVRTSTGMFLSRGADDVIRDIEKRIADFTFIPVENGEGLQVLHYGTGEKYEPHSDYFVDKFNIENSGQRVATLLMYLSDVEEGGETIFPGAKTEENSSVEWRADEAFDCRKLGGLLQVKPKMGNALLFWDLKPDATEDINSLHGGCPVIKGDKWSATKWMHLKPL